MPRVKKKDLMVVKKKMRKKKKSSLKLNREGPETGCDRKIKRKTSIQSGGKIHKQEKGNLGGKRGLCEQCKTSKRKERLPQSAILSGRGLSVWRVKRERQPFQEGGRILSLRALSPA